MCKEDLSMICVKNVNNRKNYEKENESLCFGDEGLNFIFQNHF